MGLPDVLVSVMLYTPRRSVGGLGWDDLLDRLTSNCGRRVSELDLVAQT